jgi:DNA-binding beta-propeller fold protein YncE
MTTRMRITLATIVATAIAPACAVDASAAVGPVKQEVVSHIGWDVNRTKEEHAAPQEERNICTVESGDACQQGTLNGGVRGFRFTKGVAGAPVGGGVGLEGNVYVADENNDRIQELAPDGEFLLMFGKKVNKKGGDVCTKAEASECQAGEPGSEAGAFVEPAKVAVDPVNGDIYITEPNNQRVDKYTPTGEFLWMAGKEVDKATKANLCTKEESAQCGAGVEASSTSEHGAFRYPHSVAVGENQTVYVGDSRRVQEFDQEGAWSNEIRAPFEAIEKTVPIVGESEVSTLTVDKSGNLYLVFEVNSTADTLLELDPTGKEINAFGPPEEASLYIYSVAADTTGRLAVVQEENGQRQGHIYQVEGKARRVISDFEAHGDEAIAFNGNDEMYATATAEIVHYAPRPIGELNVASSPPPCSPEGEQETDVTLACQLNGTVDPWGVAKTEVWFQWGYTVPAKTNPNARECTTGERTATNIPVFNTLAEGEEEALVAVSSTVSGLRPNEALCYRLAGEDANVKTPEQMTSPIASFTTNTVPPRIVGEQVAGFIKATAADLFGEINPENTSTAYGFEYAPRCEDETCAGTCKELEGCPEASRTSALRSSEYGKLGVTLEIRNLQPSTKYLYRLYAINEKGQHAVNEKGESSLPEGEFETARKPAPVASTGPASGVGQTTATISGTVDPDGQEVAYSFEIGPYNGPATHYTTVYYGAIHGGEPVIKTIDLTDLQPATTYAYRITVKSGYIEGPAHTSRGAAETFVTQPLSMPIMPTPPTEVLPTPQISFPRPPASSAPTCNHGYTRNRSGKCVRTAKSKRRHTRRAVRRRHRKH